MEQTNELRQEAEKRIAAQQIDVAALSPEAIQDLIYDLQVHQIELEMQNEHLQQTQQDLEQTHRRYVNLYDFAPTGYLTLDASNHIREANLTAANMLGLDRNALLGRSLRHFIAPANRQLFYEYRRRLFQQQTFVSAELRLLRANGSHFEVHLLGAEEKSEQEAGQTSQDGWIRLIVSDVSERKRLEEEVRRHQDHLEALVAERTAELTETNEQLKLEITEREQIEANLRENEERFRTISELMSDYVYALQVEPDGSLRPEWSTSAFDEDIAYTVAGKIEPPANNRAIYEADRAVVERRLERLLAGQEDISEYRILTEGGDVRWLRDYGRPLWDEAAGRVTGIIGAAKDITERKQAEAALRASEERFRAVWEIAADAMVLSDPEGIVLTANPAYFELYGYEPEVVIGHDFAVIFPEKQRQWARGVYKETFANEATFPLAYESVIQRADGVERIVEARIGFLTEEGRRTAMLSIIRDITDRKRMEERLKASETRQRAILEAIPDLIFHFNQEGVFLDAQGPDDILAYSLGDHIGKSAEEVLPPELVQTVIENIEDVLTSGDVITAEYHLRRDNQDRFLESRCVAGSENEVLLIIRDVTGRRQLEEQFRQSQKMEAIGQLAGGVAHHFNNLLTSIMGYVGLSLSEVPAAHPLAGNLRQIQDTAQRAATLTRQLLAFTRKQPSQPEIVDLNDLIHNIGDMFSHLINEMIDLEMDLAPNLGRATMDAGQFEQLLVNLVVNARDAMPRGGRLVIQTANVRIKPEQAPDNIPAGNYVQLIVIDTGKGMNEAVKAHIFEPFFTTKEVGQGTGLGLSTCYGIVQQHSGYIIVDSEPGHGTTFRIYLPRVDETISPTAAQAEGDAFPAGQETILLVEDEATLRELMAKVLRRLGYSVLEAENGENALRLIKKRELGKLDLLLTDMIMPKMDGEALAEQLQAWYRNLKVLLISGYSDKITDQMDAPAFPFLAKPFTPVQLAETVRRILDE